MVVICGLFVVVVLKNEEEKKKSIFRRARFQRISFFSPPSGEIWGRGRWDTPQAAP